MYTLQVKCEGRWRWSLHTYETLEAAQNRTKELAKVGIKSRVKLAAELYS